LSTPDLTAFANAAASLAEALRAEAEGRAFRLQRTGRSNLLAARLAIFRPCSVPSSTANGSKLAWVRTTEVHDVVNIDLDARDKR
jgi:hypothetical protein